jgi:hypothetical protein
MQLRDVSRMSLQVLPRLQARQWLYLDIELAALNSLCHFYPPILRLCKRRPAYHREATQFAERFRLFGCPRFSAVSKFKCPPHYRRCASEVLWTELNLISR